MIAWKLHEFAVSKAMVKAMLNSHLADSSGQCTLFSHSDYAALGPFGKFRAGALEAHGWLLAAQQFLQAYSSLGDQDKSKLLSTMSVRLVMTVHGKKAEARAAFTTLAAVAERFYKEAKSLDARLPAWNKLPSQSAASPADVSAKGAIREFSTDSIADSIMQEKGFSVDEVVYNKSNPTVQYKIHRFCPDGKTVVIKPLNKPETASTARGRGRGKKSAAAPVMSDLQDVSRFELLEHWKAVKVTAPKMLECPDPLANHELRASLIAAAVKAACAIELPKSSESECALQVQPDIKVFAGKDYKKPGALKLVMLTNSIQVAKPGLQTMACIGQAGDNLHIYAKSSNSMPEGVRETFISKYWCVRATWTTHETNCTYEEKEINVPVPAVGISAVVRVPSITNSMAIKAGDELVVLKKPQHEDGEMAVKRARK